MERFLRICQSRISTTAVGGNLHSMLADPNDSLALIVFRLFSDYRGYTRNWPLAWAVEYQIDAQGATEAFRQRAEYLAGKAWDELAEDPEIYLEVLYQAAADALPAVFSRPRRSERSTLSRRAA